MNGATVPFAEITAASKRVAQQALDIGDNRLELLLIELQETKDQLLRLLVMALAMAMFGLLAGIAFTIGMVILFWDHSPLAAVAALGSLYLVAALVLRKQVVQWRREFQPLASTIEQLRKDCQCLASHFR